MSFYGTSSIVIEMNAIPIVYENEEIIIINKPAGVSVQGGKGIAHPLDKELPEQTGHEIFLVHRLDKDTSGLMIAAKTKAAAAKWSKLVASRAVKKEYDAICIGTFAERQGVITDDIVQHGEVKRAVTQYAVSEVFEIDCGGEKLSLSLVRLALETGRMHQIRAQSAFHGFPLLGDTAYGGSRIDEVRTFFLHAYEVRIGENPVGLPPVLTSTLPAAFESFNDKILPNWRKSFIL